MVMVMKKKKKTEHNEPFFFWDSPVLSEVKDGNGDGDGNAKHRMNIDGAEIAVEKTEEEDEEEKNSSWAQKVPWNITLGIKNEEMITLTHVFNTL